MAVRGFKSWCEKIAEKYRARLKVEKHLPLCPWTLAKHLKIVVWYADAIPGLPANSLKQLIDKGSDEWSAVTMVWGKHSLVILNPSASKARQASDLMHELAHIIMGHKPARVDITTDGMLLLHLYDPEQEEEADLLSACLLLPRDALVHIKENKLSNKDAQALYGVSQEMLNYRINITGVAKQFKGR